MSTTVLSGNRFHPDDADEVTALLAELVPNKIESMELGPGYGTITFEGDLTEEQQYLVQRRMHQDPVEENRERQLVQAYQALTTFIDTPNAQLTQSQVVQQVKIHARILRFMIRREYGDAGGTLGPEPTA